MSVLTPALLNLLRSRLDHAAATDTKRNNSLNLEPTTFLKGCKQLLHYHPFKPREIQRLYDGDHQDRMDLANYILGKVGHNLNWLRKVTMESLV